MPVVEAYINGCTCVGAHPSVAVTHAPVAPEATGRPDLVLLAEARVDVGGHRAARDKSFNLGFGDQADIDALVLEMLNDGRALDGGRCIKRPDRFRNSVNET